MVKFDPATFQQHLLEQFAPSLNPRFCPRQRQTLLLSNLFLGQTLKFGHFDSLLVSGRELIDQGPKTLGQFLLNILFKLNFLYYSALINLFSGSLLTIIIYNNVSGYLIHPRQDFFLVFQGVQAFVDFDQNILDKVFGHDRVIDSPQNKTV